MSARERGQGTRRAAFYSVFFLRLRQWFVVVALCLALPAMSATGPVTAEGRVEVLFSPHDEIEPRLIALIDGARHSVHVQSFIFTRKTVAHALIAAHRRGVKVAVLVDDKMHRRGKNALPLLLAAGVPVAFDGHYASAHNKVLLIDAAARDAVIVTGSYNLTWSAARKNAENVLILYGQRRITRAYLDNWQRHFDAARQILRLPAAREP